MPSKPSPGEPTPSRPAVAARRAAVLAGLTPLGLVGVLWVALQADRGLDGWSLRRPFDDLHLILLAEAAIGVGLFALARGWRWAVEPLWPRTASPTRRRRLVVAGAILAAVITLNGVFVRHGVARDEVEATLEAARRARVEGRLDDALDRAGRALALREEYRGRPWERAVAFAEDVDWWIDDRSRRTLGEDRALRELVGWDRHDALHETAGALLGRGDAAGALAALDRVAATGIELDPLHDASPDHPLLRAEALYQLGRFDEAEGLVSALEKRWRDYPSATPRGEDPWLLRGDLARRRGQVETARGSYAKAAAGARFAHRRRLAAEALAALELEAPEPRPQPGPR